MGPAPMMTVFILSERRRPLPEVTHLLSPSRQLQRCEVIRLENGHEDVVQFGKAVGRKNDLLLEGTEIRGSRQRHAAKWQYGWRGATARGSRHEFSELIRTTRDPVECGRGI